MKDYKLSYLFQRPRIFNRLFKEFSGDLKNITGLTYEEWNNFHQSLCRMIENKIKTIEIHTEKNNPSYFTLKRRGLKKKLKKYNKDFSNSIDYLFHESNIVEAHIIDLSDCLIDLLDKKLLENKTSYAKHRENILVESIQKMFGAIKDKNTQIYKNLYYSESEIDLVVVLQDTVIFIEIKHTKQSKLRRLYDQLKRRSTHAKNTSVMKLWNKEKDFNLNLNLEGKEMFFLGIIYDDPFYKMDLIDIDEESLHKNFIFMTYFNLEAIFEIIIHEQEDNHLTTFLTYLNTRLEERKRYKEENIGVVFFGDEVTNFKHFYFYNLDSTTMMNMYSDYPGQIVIDVNYDIVDKKYDRINIQNEICINKPIKVYLSSIEPSK